MPSKYETLMIHVFLERWKQDAREISFTKGDVEILNRSLDLQIKNLPDMLYTFRYRAKMPMEIASRAPTGKIWAILPTGTATYKFVLTTDSNIVPNLNLLPIKIPDSTPEVIRMYSLGDEQAALAILRYNRLVDLFLGVTAYSVQNHLRTSVEGVGQMEIDELYVGVGMKGTHFIIPVQAKRGSDKIGIVQLYQDLAFCRLRYPTLEARSLAVQKIDDNTVAILELSVADANGILEVKVREERHYRLVSRDEISTEDLLFYKTL